jgi:hypothetical protein
MIVATFVVLTPVVQALRDLVTGLILNENFEMALQDEEDFLNFVCMRRISLPGGTNMIYRVKFSGWARCRYAFPNRQAPMKGCWARLKPSIFASSNAAQSARRSALSLSQTQSD